IRLLTAGGGSGMERLQTPPACQIDPLNQTCASGQTHSNCRPNEGKLIGRWRQLSKRDGGKCELAEDDEETKIDRPA
ncbi:unnamed protein product, partial [Citrullus colocynthis]